MFIITVANIKRIRKNSCLFVQRMVGPICLGKNLNLLIKIGKRIKYSYKILILHSLLDSVQ